MSKLQFYRNRRKFHWVEPDSLWVRTTDGRVHSVGADESLVFEASEVESYIPWLYEVDPPADLHPDDLPMSS